jgi:hypothetical protein
MKSNIARPRLIKEVQEQFTQTYPYLKIDFTKGKGGRAVNSLVPNGTNAALPYPAGQDDAEDIIHTSVQKLLWDEFGLNDEMKISELEVLLQYEFGLPAQILRKSGNMWLETRMTQHWTLRQQNDHGKDIAQGFL